MAELSINLYDATKQIVSKMPPMDPIESNQMMLGIGLDMVKCQYAMLYCKDLSDFTIFRITDSENNKKAASELAKTIYNRGNLIQTEKQEDGAWEIWIRDLNSNEDNCYYLFDFSQAIVEV